MTGQRWGRIGGGGGLESFNNKSIIQINQIGGKKKEFSIFQRGQLSARRKGDKPHIILQDDELVLFDDPPPPPCRLNTKGRAVAKTVEFAA